MQVVRTLVINLILGALVIAAAALTLSADRFWPLVLPKLLEPLAWPLLILGIFLILAAEYSLITVGHASGAPANPPPQLVTTGIYRWARNPIYLGAASLLFSLAFFNNSPTMLLIAFVFLPSIHAVVILFEEPRLERRFGVAYTDYKKNTPRWLPRSPKPGKSHNIVK